MEMTEEKGYVTDLITKYAIEFIEANKDDPFCLYVAHEVPHYPFQGRNDKADRFPGRKFVQHGSRKDKKGAYKEMIEVMDEGIGKVIDKLEELQLNDKTLVFFCSDNGGLDQIANNGILRGSKGSLWEGGHRVPAIAWWPGNIEAGSLSSETVMSMDLFPTFVNLSKMKGDKNFDFDGIDISRLLLEQRDLPDRSVFWKYRKQKVIRKENWKLIVDKDTSRLYNLWEDIAEQNDVAQSEKSLVSELKFELDSWEKDVSAGVKMITE